MTLQVPFDQFLPTVRRLLGNAPAYLCAQASGTLATAADPARHLIVACRSPQTIERTRETLRVQGLEAFDGLWREGDETAVLEQGAAIPYVAAVSYKTEGDTPGVWVDAFQELPTQVMALRSLYEEFRGTGELGEDISFEEFVRVANPNVVIVSPEDLASYVRQREAKEQGG